MQDIDKCYKILELNRNSSYKEIKQAYRDLVKIWHPDRFTHDQRLQKKAQDKLKEINNAYKTLISFHESEKKQKHETSFDQENNNENYYENKRSYKYKNTFKCSSPRIIFGKFTYFWYFLLIIISILILSIFFFNRVNNSQAIRKKSSQLTLSADAPPSKTDPRIGNPNIILGREYVSHVLDSFIKSTVTNLKAEVTGREVQSGDLDGDGDEDVIANYTIEGVNGGNNWHVQLAAFINDKGTLVFADKIIFEDFKRGVTLKKVENGVILCQSYTWAENDPHCCPSINNPARFILKDLKLLEIK